MTKSETTKPMSTKYIIAELRLQARIQGGYRHKALIQWIAADRIEQLESAALEASRYAEH